MIDGESGEQAAEWVGRCDASTAAAIALKLARQFGRTVIAVELNMGEVSADIIGDLRAGGLSREKDKWPYLYSEQDSGGQWRSGWKTDPESRAMMLDEFTPSGATPSAIGTKYLKELLILLRIDSLHSRALVEKRHYIPCANCTPATGRTG